MYLLRCVWKLGTFDLPFFTQKVVFNAKIDCIY